MPAMAMSARGRFRREIVPRETVRSLVIEGMFRPIPGPSLPPCFGAVSSGRGLVSPQVHDHGSGAMVGALRAGAATPTVAEAPSRAYGVSGAGDPFVVRLEAVMFELAFDEQGTLIELPSTAVGWRVRKLRARGQPELVYSADGLPLTLPIDASLIEFGCVVHQEGCYRLDPVDEQHRGVAGARSAYVRLALRPEPPWTRVAMSSAISPDATTTVIRTNLDLAKTILDQVALLLGVASSLLRTAEYANQATTSNPDLMK